MALVASAKGLIIGSEGSGYWSPAPMELVMDPVGAAASQV